MPVQTIDIASLIYGIEIGTLLTLIGCLISGLITIRILSIKGKA